MAEISIRVRGEHRAEFPAERGTVHLSCSVEGADPSAVRSGAERAAADLVAGLEGMHDDAAGPVRRLVVDQVRTSAHRPWRAKGRERPLVHRAHVEVSAEFDDFGRLGAWLSGLAERPAAQVRWIHWDLARERRREVEREVRQEALRQARQRAQDYADALDLGAVEVRSVADAGLLGQPGAARPEMLMARGAPDGAADDDAGLGDLLRPEDIEVSAEVQAEFVIVRRD